MMNLMRKTRRERQLSLWLCLGFFLLVLSYVQPRLGVNIFIARLARPEREPKWVA